MTLAVSTGTVTTSGALATVSVPGAWENVGNYGIILIRHSSSETHAYVYTSRPTSSTVVVSLEPNPAHTNKEYVLLSAFDLSSLTDNALNDTIWLASWFRTLGIGLSGQVATGTVNAIQLAVSNVADNHDAPLLIFRPSGTNSGSVTLQVNSLTPVPLVTTAGSAISSGTLSSDLIVIAQWDAANSRYVLVAPTAPSAATLLESIRTVDGAGSGLDADLLDGNSSAYYLAASAYTASDVLAKVLTVDGAGSGLDADLLDGNSSAYFATASDAVSKSSASQQTLTAGLALNGATSVKYASSGYWNGTAFTATPAGLIIGNKTAGGYDAALPARCQTARVRS